MCSLSKTLIVKLKQHESYDQLLRPPELRLRSHKTVKILKLHYIFQHPIDISLAILKDAHINI
jgi:hypothetical protein